MGLFEGTMDDLRYGDNWPIRQTSQNFVLVRLKMYEIPELTVSRRRVRCSVEILVASVVCGLVDWTVESVLVEWR